MIADTLGTELPEWNVKIFATDLDEAAINFARRGLYPDNLLENLPAHLRERYFERVDQGYRIMKALRQVVIFGQQDLSRGVPFPRIDLVVCRNLLIYFEPELQQHVLNLFAYSLQETGGFLFLGRAESARPSQLNFEIVHKKWKLYRSVGVSTPIVLAQERGHMPRPLTYRRRAPQQGANGPEMQAKPASSGSAAGSPIMQREAALTQLRRFNEIVLRQFPGGIVIIDRRYTIVTANSAARRTLGLREPVNEQDFLHSVRGLPYELVRNAIDEVFRERATKVLPQIEISGGSAATQYLSLTIVPMQSEEALSDLAVISALDVTEQVTAKRRLETVQHEQKQLVEELSMANKRLAEMNKDLQDTNEELQAANEELMLTQEELQATNEEFEATNEELQATNEELETNNEELQATNEELETTNDEMSARTNELRDLADVLAAERLRLSEMVELAPFYIMVLRGPRLLVEAYNPNYARLFGGRDITGFPVEQVFQQTHMGELIAIVRAAFRGDEVRTTDPIATSVFTGDSEAQQKHFAYTVVPSHDTTGRVDAVVLYAEDVTEDLARGAAARVEHIKQLVEQLDHANLGLYDAQTTTLLAASPRYLNLLAETHALEHDSILGREWRELTLIGSKREAAATFKSVVNGGEPRRLSAVRSKSRADGRAKSWDMTLIPVAFPDGSGTKSVNLLVVSLAEAEETHRESTAAQAEQGEASH
jgi:PAS domain-containing protein